MAQTLANEPYHRIFTALRNQQGAMNRISRYDLAHEAGVPDRTMRDILHSMRMAGIPVGTDSENGGYYWMVTLEELTRTTNELQSRAHKLWEAARRMRRSWDELGRQQYQKRLDFSVRDLSVEELPMEQSP